MKAILRLLNLVRLGFFPLSYGLVGALMGATLNRIMLADIGFQAIWVGVFFAASDLVAPVRVWLGYRSDGFPIFGRRREPYIFLGALVTGVSVWLVTQLANQGPSNGLLLLTLVLAFIMFGVGRNLAHNSWQALLADRFQGAARPRAMTTFEVLTVVGVIMGSGIIGQLLQTYEAGRLLAVALALATAAFVLALLATLGQEPRTATVAVASAQAREQSFRQVLQDVVLSDPQVRLFFVLVMFTFVGTLAQDVFLEPYGGLVLGMDVGATTGLTQFWGLGLIAAMLLGGTVLIKWLGALRVLRIGLVVNMVVFAAIIVAGVQENVALFRGMVLVMGLGTGLAGAGMLTIVINFTSTLRAGLLLGVWGVANQVGRALGSLMGGTVVEVGQRLTDGNNFLSYAAVFVAEILLLVVAYGLSLRLDLKAARAYEEEKVTLGALQSLPAAD